MPSAERERILRAAFLNAGRQLGEFSQMPKLRTAEDAHRTVRFEGREMVMDTLAEGRGALFLTGHFGAWELSPYCLRLTGSPPVNFLVRRIDNPRVEALADRYRTLCGNRTIDKSKAARPVLAALARGEMVGILADLNTLEHEGVFVNFFGVPASTTAGLAVIALKTGAPVIPVRTRWDEKERRYVQTFEPELELIRTGSRDEDVLSNTQAFTAIIERWIREDPDQWIWVHRRWKTRPRGEASMY
jgi:KDO2-lipid IV(A) lauroyltransferase